RPRSLGSAVLRYSWDCDFAPPRQQAHRASVTLSESHVLRSPLLSAHFVLACFPVTEIWIFSSRRVRLTRHPRLFAWRGTWSRQNIGCVSAPSCTFCPLLALNDDQHLSDGSLRNS
ncbi:hypothetical protein TcCL_NonESM13095, partial [Trypanosoma cruzi]